MVNGFLRGNVKEEEDGLCVAVVFYEDGRGVSVSGGFLGTVGVWFRFWTLERNWGSRTGSRMVRCDAWIVGCAKGLEVSIARE